MKTKKTKRASQRGLQDSSELLDVNGVMELTGYSRIVVYRLVRYRMIPYYKPFGGKLFFKRSELLEALTRVRFGTRLELDAPRQKRVGYSAVEDFQRAMKCSDMV